VIRHWDHGRALSLRPPDQRRHGGEDRLDIAAGLEPEDRAAVVERITDQET